MNENLKQSEQEITKEYTRNFFQGTLDQIKEISDKTGDNPAEFSMMCSATIDGLSQDLPEQDLDTDIGLFKTVENAIVKDKAEKQAKKQLAAAIENNGVSVQQAYQSAVKSAEDGDPLALQAARSSLFLDTIQDEIDSKRMSEKLGRSITIKYGQDIIMKNLSAALLSDTSAENKAKMVYMVLAGKTGEKAWDVYSSPTERAQGLSSVLGIVKTVENYREDLLKSEQQTKLNFFNDEYRNALLELATKEYPDYSYIDNIKQNLYSIAPASEYDKIANIESVISPSSTSPLVMMQLNKMKKEGSYNSDTIYDLIARRALVGSEAKEALKELSSPLGTNLNSTAAKVAIANAKYKTNFTENNQAEFQRWYASFQNLIGDRTLTEQEINKAAIEANKSSAPLHDTSRDIALEQKIKFGEETGISQKQMLSYIANAKQTIQKDDPTFPEIEKDLRESLKNNILYQKQIGQPIELFDSDGEILEEKELIDLQMAKAKELIERMQ